MAKQYSDILKTDYCNTLGMCGDKSGEDAGAPTLGLVHKGLASVCIVSDGDTVLAPMTSWQVSILANDYQVRVSV